MLGIGIGDRSMIKTRKFKHNMWIYVILFVREMEKERETLSICLGLSVLIMCWLQTADSLQVCLT